MSVQTAYTQNIGRGLAGQVADIHSNEIVTATVKVAGSDVIPGIACKIEATSTKDRVIEKGVATALFAGISVRDLSNEVVAGDIVYAAEKTLPVMRKGYLFCVIPTGGNAGNALLANATTGVIDVGTAGVGEFQLDATLEEVTTAGAVGMIRINSLSVVAGV